MRKRRSSSSAKLPGQPLDHSLSIVPMRKNVEGFVQSPLGDFAFDGLIL